MLFIFNTIILVIKLKNKQYIAAIIINRDGNASHEKITTRGMRQMNQKMLSVGEFSKITRTSAKALRHYDKIGLLSPMTRGENNYRYYSIRQLALCNAIRVLLKVGVPLAEISGLKRTRTPEIVDKILARQKEAINAEIDKLRDTHILLDTFALSIKLGLQVDENIICIQYLPAENVIIGAQNDYSNGKDDYDALFDFYKSVSDMETTSELELLYPIWAIHSAEKIIKGDYSYPERYYFYNPKGQDERPAAMYAIGHMRAGYGQNDELFERIKCFIDQNGFEICGNAYEEYLFNEVCIRDDTKYLLRIMITVREKGAHEAKPAPELNADYFGLYSGENQAYGKKAK